MAARERAVGDLARMPAGARGPLTLAAPGQRPTLKEPPAHERVFSLHSPPAASHCAAVAGAGASFLTQHWT